MPTTDTSERGLESLIFTALTGTTTAATTTRIHDDTPSYGTSAGYVPGRAGDFDKDYAVDGAKLLDFLRATQPDVVAELKLEVDSIDRQRFLARLRDEITRRGIVDVLRNGVKDLSASVVAFYGTPSPGNPEAAKHSAANLLSVTRQLHFSMDSYRVEVKSTLDLALEDEDGVIDPVPTGAVGVRPEPEIDYLSNIIREFNELFAGVDWNDQDKVMREIAETPTRVAADQAYQNALKHSDRQNARIEHDRALDRVMLALMSDFTELFKQYSDNPDLRHRLSDRNFEEAYQAAGA